LAQGRLSRTLIKSRTLPEVLSRAEVVRFLEAVPSLKSRVVLTTAYATGLRVSEVVAVEVPERYGRYTTVSNRFNRRRKVGVWDRRWMP
jgi:site-specific recombinase XerD